MDVVAKRMATLSIAPDSTSAALPPCAGEYASLRLDFASPFTRNAWSGHGFVGAWSRGRQLEVIDTSSEGAQHGRNWFVQAAQGENAGERVHANAPGDLAVAFDGYVVDPPLHQRSPSSVILPFWHKHRHDRVNGLFSAAIIEPASDSLVLRTDAFGFAPLYYRDLGEVVLFATQADWLLTPGTASDDVALASIIGNGYIVGNRSLYQDIHRVPLGGCITFTADGAAPRVARFDLEVTGTANQPATAAHLDHVDACFRQAVERCLALDHGPVMLGLSSGLDSRRILGKLLDAGVRPPAATVRILQKGERDLDAPIARSIAQHAGLAHRVVELPDPRAFARDCILRHRLIGGETTRHDWGMTLQRSYPDHVATIFNGFLGDTVDDSKHPWNGMFKDPLRDLELYVASHAELPGRGLLAPMLDCRDQLAATVREYLTPYSGLRHAADLADVVLSMRRGNAISTQLARPCHLEVKPFVDLDYLRAVSDIDPCAKIDPGFRRELLARYHPDLAHFGGTAEHPDVFLRPGQHTVLQRARANACVAALAHDVHPSVQRRVLRRKLSPRGRALAAMTRHVPAATRRWHWALRPILEAVLHQARTPPVWRLRTVIATQPHAHRGQSHAAQRTPA